MPSTLSLVSYQILRPEKIRWHFHLIENNILASLKSKSLKKFLAKYDSIIKDNNLSVEHKILDTESFEKWLEYYRRKMLENNYDIIASTDWYDDRTKKGLSIEGLFFYQNSKLVGSGIITRNSNEQATFAFKASERIDLGNDENSSIGAMIDYLFLKFAVDSKTKIISAGQSRNAFGVINTYGYLDYKFKLGYLPLLPEKPTFADSIPLSENGVGVFFGQYESMLTLYIFKPKGVTFKLEAARYSSSELPVVEIEY